MKKSIIWFIGGGISSLVVLMGIMGTTTLFPLWQTSAQTPSYVAIHTPSQRTVFQRAPASAAIQISGVYGGGVRKVEARAVVTSGYTGTQTEWVELNAPFPGTNFSGALTVNEGGWYKIQVRGLSAKGTVLDEDVVERIGVGEVFIVLGQSNSTNNGLPRLTATYDQVSSFNLCTSWEHTRDPQPIATGEMGSPWPALGDFLVERFSVPIGFVSVGVAGTSVEDWLPEGDLYPRLQNAIHNLQPFGFRAILWHQGEKDSKLGTSKKDYAMHLSTVIQESRIDAGWDIPWGIAIAAFTPNGNAQDQKVINNAQRHVINSDTQIFQGANTDELTGLIWRYDGTHFNEAGLHEHARRWADEIETWIYKPVFTP